MKWTTTLIVVFLLAQNGFGQRKGYWQQHVDYYMEINMDVEKWQFEGHQELELTNNSDDALDRVYYHLFFNAFQPGSMMDVRSRTISDPDSRVGDRIASLSEEEIGYLKPTLLTQDGREVEWEVTGTILKVELDQPIPPGKRSTLVMNFDGQVPVQIRRSGRNNREGIDLSMAQWYPKLCNYDDNGWHPNPYISREFYPVWGDYEVKITIDKDYILGGTGYLQNANEIGYGYEDEGVKIDHSGVDELTWHFVAPNVHDFMWAADPEYVHYSLDMEDGPRLHFLFKGEDSTMVENWYRLGEYTERAMQFANARYGKYPYDQYSVIQGGDGGMEYPMGTLITGRRQFGSLIGVTVHELMHSWYQMVLATHELLYPWMDEGFTTYASAVIMNELFPSEDGDRELHQRAYAGYLSIAGTEDEDPLTTHGDHFQTNRAYGIAAYSKGQVYLHQLSYVVGQDVLDRALLRFFRAWKYKHPTPDDFLRIVEKEADLILDWYNEYFVKTTNTIDYAIRAVEQVGRKTRVTLERVGRMPMPVEVLVKFKNGDEKLHYMPLVMMHGQKSFGETDTRVVRHDPWPWTHPTYTLELDISAGNIASIEIDPSLRMADTDRSNNLLLLPEDIEFIFHPSD